MIFPWRCSPEHIFRGGRTSDPTYLSGRIHTKSHATPPARSWKLTRSDQSRRVNHTHDYQPTQQTPHDRGYTHPQRNTRGKSNVTGLILFRRMVPGVNYSSSVMSPRIRTDTSQQRNFRHSSSHKSNFVHTTTT